MYAHYCFFAKGVWIYAFVFKVKVFMEFFLLMVKGDLREISIPVKLKKNNGTWDEEENNTSLTRHFEGWHMNHLPIISSTLTKGSKSIYQNSDFEYLAMNCYSILVLRLFVLQDKLPWLILVTLVKSNDCSSNTAFMTDKRAWSHYILVSALTPTWYNVSMNQWIELPIVMSSYFV